MLLKRPHDSSLARSFAAMLLLLACLCVSSVFAFAQAPPLVEQCAALAEEGSAEVTQALAALESKDSAARIAAAHLLSHKCEQRAVAPLIKLLGDDEPLVQAAAVEALGRLGDRTAIDPLIGLTENPDPKVKLALAHAFCAFQVDRASYAALNYVLGKGQPQDADDMRARAAAAIGIHQLRNSSFSRKALIILLNFTAEQNGAVRQIALETVRALKETRNGPAEFVGILKQSQNPLQRRTAAYWIGELRLERGRDALVAAAESDRDAEVKTIAAAALAKLGKAEPE